MSSGRYAAALLVTFFVLAINLAARLVFSEHRV
jgi:ABC-type phosphate transport system permease subunit